MAQDTTVPKLNFEYWLDKAIEWGQATTLESQKDVCLHLPQLQEFLHQTYETLKHMNSVAAIQQFPLIGQLLGRLCWNPFVIGYDVHLLVLDPDVADHSAREAWSPRENNLLINTLEQTVTKLAIFKTLMWGKHDQRKSNVCTCGPEPQGIHEEFSLDESQKTLMWCLCCLYSSEPQNPVELKANSWIRSLLCHLLSSSKWESNEAETSTFISALGYTSADYYCHLVKNMVSSLVTELRGNHFNGLNVQGRISASRVNAMSIYCLPLITLPDVTPLLEALLLYHGGASKEILSSEFLEAVNDAFLKKKISLSESAIFSLWLRHLPSLENATLNLLDQLASRQINSLEEVACVIKDSFLPQAASHPAIFRIVNEIFKSALLETDGTPEVMTIVQVFTQLFIEVQQSENKQYKFPVKAYFPHHHQPLVLALLRRPFEFPSVHWSQHLKHISDMLKAVVEDTDISTGCVPFDITADMRIHEYLLSSSSADLYEIWFLVACFGEWLDIAAEQLLKAAVEPDALLWLLAFYYCPQNENQRRTQTMVEAQAIYNHLIMLYNRPIVSTGDLQAAVNNVADTGQCYTQRLTTHLLTNFLLFSSGGHVIAQEFISHITETTDISKEVCSLLIRTAYRFNHNGEENQRTVELLNELLQKLMLKV